jgi:hypothetical protein
LVRAAFAAAVLFFANEAPAQDAVTAPSHGYIYAAPVLTSGGFASAAQLGGGGDVKLYKNLAISGDVGWITAQDGFGLASINGTYNLPSFREGRVAPFVTSGYTLGFRDSTASFLNFGGGFTYWLRERQGIRWEARYYTRPDFISVLTLRVGFSFR